MHLDMLGAIMKHKILGELHVAHVVAVDRDQCWYFDREVLQQSSKPYGFIGCDGSAPILWLSA